MHCSEQLHGVPAYCSKISLSKLFLTWQQAVTSLKSGNIAADQRLTYAGLCDCDKEDGDAQDGLPEAVRALLKFIV